MPHAEFEARLIIVWDRESPAIQKRQISHHDLDDERFLRVVLADDDALATCYSTGPGLA